MGKRQLIAANAERDHAFAAQFDGAARGFHGRGRAKLAHGVKDPLQAQAALCKGRGGFAHGAEIGGHILIAQEHDSRGEGDLGIDDILGEQSSARRSAARA